MRLLNIDFSEVGAACSSSVSGTALMDEASICALVFSFGLGYGR